MLITTGTVAIVFYLLSIVLALLNQTSNKNHLLVATSSLGLVAHIFVLWELVVLNWINLSLFHSLSFASAFILFSLLITYRWYSLSNMLVIMLPVTIITLILELANPTVSHSQAGFFLDMHILLSILAYSFLSIATVLASILFVQEKSLKAKKLTGLIEKLPPLTEAEATLFKVVRLGFVLLTCSLFSGFIFVENIVSQNLSHKTVFSVLSWIVFAVLLFGRIKYGWRGKTAINFTLSGIIFILLAYFNSKIVYEFLL